MKYLYVLSIPFIFTSCNISDHIASWGTIGITIFFAILMLVMIGMFFYVARKRKQSEGTANKFSQDVKAMLDRIEGTDKKISALEFTVGRILSDKAYQKDTIWQDKLLSKVFQHMATVYYEDNQHDKVIEVCTEIIRLEPSHMMSYYNRGTLYSNLGMYDKAIKDLTEAINLDQNYANSYNNRGMAYEKSGNRELAIGDYDLALGIEPSPTIYYNRGNTYMEMEEYDKALADFHTALNMGIEAESNLKQNIDRAIKYLKTKV